MTTRRTLALSAALCAVLAGCGQNETTNTGSAAPTTPAVTTTAAPTTAESTATAEPSEPTDATQTSGATPDGTGAATPRSTSTPRTNAASSGAASVAQTDPGDYADAAVEAWRSGDRSELAKYVSGSAAADLGSNIPRGELLRTACEGDMCSYTTEDGKRVTLSFDLDAVRAGKGGGITGAKVD